MPLAFKSLSHGTVPFGFFNIESDLLLLDRSFFFAPEFCELVAVLAEDANRRLVLTPAWVVDASADIGDLMGAIQGIRLTGLIGEVYRRFPFPQEPAGFKQKPGGWKTRPVMLEILGRRAVRRDLPVAVESAEGAIAIGAYRFNRTGFHALVDYVWRGGYPRWEEEVRPDYVMTMAEAVQASRQPYFDGLSNRVRTGPHEEAERNPLPGKSSP
jgi:hypothetical protein